MGKTKKCFIISASSSFSLNIDNENGRSLKLSDTSRDLWTKHNWLIEIVNRHESTYDDNFVEGRKSQSGLLRAVSYSGNRKRSVILKSKFELNLSMSSLF